MKKRILRLGKEHKNALILLDRYSDGKLISYYEYFRLQTSYSHPVANIKKYIINDLIEHEKLTKNGINFLIRK